ncbi:MAG: hypothetical protein U0183_09965 [Polyangiaceae bacterium]
MRRSFITCAFCLGFLSGCSPSQAPVPKPTPRQPAESNPAPSATSGFDVLEVVGACEIAKGRVGAIDVLVLSNARAGFKLLLPQLPSPQIDCSPELAKKRPGLVATVYFKATDAYVALFSEPSNEVISEKRTLEAIGAGHAKKLVDELKATPREPSVDGLPGAMIATVEADVPTPKGGAVTALQLVTVRQRSSDKRVFSLWVSLGEPTAEERGLWRSYLALPENPGIQSSSGEPVAPSPPKNAATH